MSLIVRNLPLPIHNPGYPEKYVCDPAFGRNIIPVDCQIAVDTNWPKGTTPAHYYFKDPSPSNSIRLPIHDHQGSCTVSIESAGPMIESPKGKAEQQHHFSLPPTALRSVAGYIIQKCAEEQRGIGGFVTLRFSATEKWIASLTMSANELRQDNGTMGRPNDGAFLTISITSPSSFEFRPGDTDPSIAATLSNIAANTSERYPEKEQPHQRRFFLILAQELRHKTASMKRGRSDGETWWDGLDDDGGSWDTGQGPNGDDDTESTGSSPVQDDTGEGGDEIDGNINMSDESTPNDNNEKTHNNLEHQDVNEIAHDSDMTYQCDATLGSPSATDCEQLVWSGLKPPDAIETLHPNSPNIYTQGTCALGISSSMAMTISWAHLLAAFDTLNTLCVQNPIRLIKGGRAFYGVQGISSWINGKRSSMGRKRGSVAGVSGTEALPVGVNATVWRHEGAGRAALDCEWRKAMEGVNIREC